MNSKVVLFSHICFLISYYLSITTATPVKSLLSDRKYCGYQHTDDYVRPNNNISIDEFPWMAQLMLGNSQVGCGGSLISNRYVLSAAHCVINPYGTVTAVRLGDYNTKTESDCVVLQEDLTECNEPLQQFDIEEIIAHSLYYAEPLVNDIALIRLSKPVTFSDYVRPICLPKRNAPELKVGDLFATSGWGYKDNSSIQTDFKKRVTATLLSNTVCLDIYKNGQIFTVNNLCVGATDDFTCAGDSGSPLMYSVKYQWEQVGVVSYGRGCSHDFATVYVKVSDYLNWIEENLRP